MSFSLLVHILFIVMQVSVFWNSSILISSILLYVGIFPGCLLQCLSIILWAFFCVISVSLPPSSLYGPGTSSVFSHVLLFCLSSFRVFVNFLMLSISLSVSIFLILILPS